MYIVMYTECECYMYHLPLSPFHPPHTPHPSQGFNRPKEYFASQGPLPDTMGDFWRLVWDYNSPTIIMLTNLVEKMKVKCSQYWPDSGSQQYSYINVTLVDTITHSDFVIRHFRIKSVSEHDVFVCVCVQINNSYIMVYNVENVLCMYVLFEGQFSADQLSLSFPSPGEF